MKQMIETYFDLDCEGKYYIFIIKKCFTLKKKEWKCLWIGYSAKLLSYSLCWNSCFSLLGSQATGLRWKGQLSLSHQNHVPMCSLYTENHLLLLAEQ